MRDDRAWTATAATRPAPANARPATDRQRRKLHARHRRSQERRQRARAMARRAADRVTERTPGPAISHGHVSCRSCTAGTARSRPRATAQRLPALRPRVRQLRVRRECLPGRLQLRRRCADGNFCSAGPVRRSTRKGRRAAGHQCAAGPCVDGYCCDTTCTSKCEACDVTGSEGACSPVTGAPTAVVRRARNRGVSGSCDGADRTQC